MRNAIRGFKILVTKGDGEICAFSCWDDLAFIPVIKGVLVMLFFEVDALCAARQKRCRDLGGVYCIDASRMGQSTAQAEGLP